MNVLKKLQNNLLKSAILIFTFFSSVCVSAQPEVPEQINILFYNTENLFDVKDDPLTQDEEFLPDGDRHWTNFRLNKKLNQLSKLLLSAAGFEPPEIIGLAEVENREVLEMLLKNTALKNYSYTIVHKDSPDERGIDVAMLFRPDRIKPTTYRYIPVLNEKQEIQSTREILYAGFRLPEEDTIHVFFNHWPSRYQGQAETEIYRFQAAKALKDAIGLLYQINPSAKIIIMGDFNDEPQNKSMKGVLQAVGKDDQKKGSELINLSYSWKQGTIKYRQTWSVFDQIIVSDQLFFDEGWQTSIDEAKIVKFPFLLEDDLKYQGKKLNRTYVGFRYHGGFSDHLPILLKLVK